MTFTIPIDLKIVKIIWYWLALAFYNWAMREINPLHPDVPKIMRKQHAVREKLHRLWH
jgi:hypothetical protein